MYACRQSYQGQYRICCTVQRRARQVLVRMYRCRDESWWLSSPVFTLLTAFERVLFLGEYTKLATTSKIFAEALEKPHPSSTAVISTTLCGAERISRSVRRGLVLDTGKVRWPFARSHLPSNLSESSSNVPHPRRRLRPGTSGAGGGPLLLRLRLLLLCR